jgi:indolepyruvate ferredoxin oxidoreductase beta subunit
MTGYDVYLVGIGGQGVLTIGEIIMAAAFQNGYSVNFYPTKGMAQRGGFVKAQLRMGSEAPAPGIPEKGADLVISTEVSETLHAVRHIKPGGEVVLFACLWAPTAVMIGKAPYPSLDEVADHVRRAGATLTVIEPESLPLFEGAPVPENIFTLGVALARTRLRQIISAQDVETFVRNRWKRGVERNVYALDAGLKAEPPSTVPEAVDEAQLDLHAWTHHRHAL